MIHVENGYEPIIYEQPIRSHIYQNHDHFLLNYYTRPISSNKTIEKTVEEITEKKNPQNIQAQVTFTNIYLKKRNYQKKTWTIPLILKSPKCNELQTPDLEIEFVIDSEADPNIINIPTWNENNTLQNNMQASSSTRINPNKLLKNPTFPCSHSNNGTE